MHSAITSIWQWCEQLFRSGCKYWFSLFFVSTELCVGGWSEKSVFVPVAVLHVRACDSACVCLWVSNVVTKPAHCGLMGGKGSALHQHHPTFTVTVCWEHCSVTCNLSFMQNPNTTCTHLLQCTHSLTRWPYPGLTFSHLPWVLN